MLKMILHSIKIISISFLIVIGLETIRINAVETPSDFSVYVETYEELSGTKVTTPITFVDEFQDNVVGVCYVYLSGIKEIKISKKFWFNRGYATREQLIFHELAHCEAGLEHDDDEIVYNGLIIPETIMNSYLVDPYTYTTFRQYYLNELFNKKILKK